MGLRPVGEQNVGGASTLVERADEDDLLQAIEAREVIERSLVRLAADRRTDGDLVHLARACAQLRDAADDREAFVVADLAFHLVLSRAAHNDLLAARLAALHDRLTEMIDLYAGAAFREGGVAVLVDAHERLADAVGRRDGDRAHQILIDMMARLRREVGVAASSSTEPSTAGPAVQSKGDEA